MKRVKYLELAKIADDICVMLMEKGIKPSEGCVIRRIAETQWDNMRASYGETQGRLSNTVCEQPMEANAVLSDTL